MLYLLCLVYIGQRRSSQCGEENEVEGIVVGMLDLSMPRESAYYDMCPNLENVNFHLSCHEPSIIYDDMTSFLEEIWHGKGATESGLS